MTVTWNDFKNYLENNILETEEEEEETIYSLRPEIKDKYSLSKETELIAALADLIASIEEDNIKDNHYSLLSDNKCHPLPDLAELVEQKTKQVKTWSELFPKREETFFGTKDNNQELDRETFTILGKIFNEWVQNTTRVERLASTFSDDEIMSKFLLETSISSNYETIKRKGYDRQLKEWLKEYQQLTSNEQEELAKQKETVEKFLKVIEEENDHRQTQQSNEKSWWNNIPWQTIAWYGGGGLLILLVIGWLWNKKE